MEVSSSSSSGSLTATSSEVPQEEGSSLLQRSVQLRRAQTDDNSVAELRVWQPGRRPATIKVPSQCTTAQAWSAISVEFPNACLAYLAPAFPQHKKPLQCVLPPNDAAEGFTALLHRYDREEADAVHIVLSPVHGVQFAPAIPDGTLLFNGLPWRWEYQQDFHGMRLTLRGRWVVPFLPRVEQGAPVFTHLGPLGKPHPCNIRQLPRVDLGQSKLLSTLLQA